MGSFSDVLESGSGVDTSPSAALSIFALLRNRAFLFFSSLLLLFFVRLLLVLDEGCLSSELSVSSFLTLDFESVFFGLPFVPADVVLAGK